MLSLFYAQICFGCFPPPLPPPPPPPPVIQNCNPFTIDVVAITTLKAFPQKPYEWGVSFDCKQVGNAIIPVPVNVRHSFMPGQLNDPCKVKLQPTAATAALGHTHPYFNNA